MQVPQRLRRRRSQGSSDCRLRAGMAAAITYKGVGGWGQCSLRRIARDPRTQPAPTLLPVPSHPANLRSLFRHHFLRSVPGMCCPSAPTACCSNCLLHPSQPVSGTLLLRLFAPPPPALASPPPFHRRLPPPFYLHLQMGVDTLSTQLSVDSTISCTLGKKVVKYKQPIHAQGFLLAPNPTLTWSQLWPGAN